MALKLHNRRWYLPVFLVGSATAIVVWLCFSEGRRPELLLSAIGGLAGLTYFLYRQHLDETKLFKELYTDFNKRYDSMNDHLNSILFGPPEGPLSVGERECLFSYFNLCAEEYFFYTVGYIDYRVWESWCRGMKVFFNHPRIQTLWEQDCKADSYYGFRPPQ
ncbi:MAG TPA: hypothetical protein VG033_07765 [Candidatus Acidoferrales bacterium]|jgi:hypothetical protein|nr:hypothetical protein [Candidatus Acidoferrales bacterium]